MKALDKEGISTVLRQSETGLVSSITYIDHRTKCVFNGSALSKPYSAKAIQERCEQAGLQSPQAGLKVTAESTKLPGERKGLIDAEVQSSASSSNRTFGILSNLLQPEQNIKWIPGQLKKKKRNYNNI